MKHYIDTSTFYEFSDWTCPEALERLKREAAQSARDRIAEIIPAAYQDSDPSRLQPEFKQACDNWTLGNIGLGLVGPTGRTKTRCLFAVIARVLQDLKIQRNTPDRGAASYFCQIPRVEAINDAAFGRLAVDSSSFSNDQAKSELKNLFACDLLLLDDIGQSRMSPQVCTELLALVESRTSSNKPLLFSTNFSGKALSERFDTIERGDACVRRLTEFCQIVRLK